MREGEFRSPRRWEALGEEVDHVHARLRGDEALLVVAFDVFAV